MGLFSAFGRNKERRSDGGPQDDRDAEFRALAHDLDLEFRRAGQHHLELSGYIDGYRIVATISKFASGVKVRFDSGLSDLSIRSRWQDLRTNRVDFATGDEAFDASFRVLLKKDGDPASALDYLNPQRREAIFVLQGIVPIKEIEEDDLEVRFDAEPSSSEFRQAILGCLNAARALDASTPPQDRVLRAS